MTNDELNRRLKVVRKAVGGDFEVSWAGPCPWTADGICFGSENGTLAWFSGEILQIQPQIIPSCEAVNGVAFLGNDRVAISSRSEIAILNIPRQKGGIAVRGVVPGGAFDVIATHSEHFVAPLGLSGIMVMKPSGGTGEKFAIIRSQRDANFYKGINLRKDGREFLAFAARQDGIWAVEISMSSSQDLLVEFGQFTFRDVDFIDICSLGPNSLAAAALGTDGTIALVRNVFDDSEMPITLLFPDIRGTGYRILSLQGHIVLLTSKALYVIKDLARRFLNGQNVANEPSFVPSNPVEAVDANFLSDREIVLVLPKGVVISDVNDLLRTNTNLHEPMSKADANRQSKYILDHQQPAQFKEFAMERIPA